MPNYLKQRVQHILNRNLDEIMDSLSPLEIAWPVKSNWVSGC